MYHSLSYNKDIIDFCKNVGEFTRCGSKSKVGYGVMSYLIEVSPITGGICEVHCWELKSSSLSTDFPQQGRTSKLLVGYSMPYTKKLMDNDFVILSSRVKDLLDTAFGGFKYVTIRFNIDHGAKGGLSFNPDVSVKYVSSSNKSIVHFYSAEDKKYLNTVYMSEATYCVE